MGTPLLTSVASVAHTAIERKAMKQLLFRISEAAQILSVSQSYLRDLVSRDEIQHIKLGRAVRFTQNQLDDFVSEKVIKAEKRKKKAEFTVN
jgi:excisionase family DNA binding protein